MWSKKAVALSVVLLGFGAIPHAQAQYPVPLIRAETFAGSEDLPGYGSLQFRFENGNLVYMTDADGTFAGAWVRMGNQMRLVFHNGTVVYSGTVRGNQLCGTASNGRTSWSWGVRLLSREFN